ncbi:MAG: lytic transglycosylase domain-containing protein [Actinomycetota bacterium]
MKREVLAPLMAAAILFTTVNSAHAQPAQVSLDLPEARLKVSPPGDSEPTWSTLLEMSEASSVDSMEMAMVSVMVAKVEAARKPKGARAVGKELAKENYGWGSYQYSCLNTLWTRESHWNYRARNPITGAHGIPQALPATRMEIISSDWRSNPITQIEWGLRYISIRYETPCRALAKFKRSRYY